ncbi:MAG: LytTR family transcriptional regulator, partial [Vallitaleaceae bacterium]|nr:LytTR family transcriptional regulator [Vallitaleaceae bacterium]
HRFSSVFIITGLMESRDEIIRGVNEDLFQRYFTKPIDLVAFRDQVHEQLTIRLSKWVNHRLQIQKKSVNMNFLFENIVYIQTNNKMTTIACKDGNYPIGRYPLARLMKDLPADRFARAGRAYLVNLTQVQSFYKTKGQCFLKFHGVEFIVPVGSLYRTEIDERLKSIQ